MGGMTGSLLLLLWAGVSVSTMVDLQKRVIDGDNCKDYERLYHVQLNITTLTGTTDLCGGSLIHPQWILTAAHCWEPGETIKAVLRVHPHGNEITETIKEENIRIYKDRNKRKHDIMLLKLEKPTTGFSRINLPDCVNHPILKKGTPVQIAGHAAITAASDKTRTIYRVPDLKCADIQVVDCPWVNDPSQKDEPHEHRFCGGTDPKDACLGDSGGGVVYDCKIYGVIVRVGIKACTAPVQFMDVCKYMPSIVKEIEATIQPKKKSCFGCTIM